MVLRSAQTQSESKIQRKQICPLNIYAESKILISLERAEPYLKALNEINLISLQCERHKEKLQISNTH